MRASRFLTLLLLLALLLSGCDSTFIQQFRATPTLGFTRQPTWTRIPSLTASIAPTRTPRPTRTITPTPTITPTHWPTRTPELIEVEPEVIAIEQAAPILGVTYRQVKNTFEPLGFVFPESMPLSTTLVHTATHPAMPMALEILGSPDFPVEASLQFKLTMDEPERTKQAAVIMVRLLNLILPGWDEASAWLFESIQEGLTSSDDFYDRSTERDGLSVMLEMNRADANVLLTVRSNPPSE